jgi:hypothetical protein
MPVPPGVAVAPELPDLLAEVTAAAQRLDDGGLQLGSAVASYVGLDPAKDIRWVRFR